MQSLLVEREQRRSGQLTLEYRLRFDGLFVDRAADVPSIEVPRRERLEPGDQLGLWKRLGRDRPRRAVDAVSRLLPAVEVIEDGLQLTPGNLIAADRIIDLLEGDERLTGAMEGADFRRRLGHAHDFALVHHV